MKVLCWARKEVIYKKGSPAFKQQGVIGGDGESFLSVSEILPAYTLWSYT